jgi:hypothetical protein
MGSERTAATSDVGATAAEAVDRVDVVAPDVVIAGVDTSPVEAATVPALSGDGPAIAPSSGIEGVAVTVGSIVTVGDAEAVSVGVAVGGVATPNDRSSMRSEAEAAPRGASMTRTRADVAPGGG